MPTEVLAGFCRHWEPLKDCEQESDTINLHIRITDSRVKVGQERGRPNSWRSSVGRSFQQLK